MGDDQRLVNKPMSHFSERVTTFLFEAAEESLTSGISERLMKQDGGEVLEKGGGREATLF